jgi:hypothetical protein
MSLLTSPDIEKEIEAKRALICEGASLQLVPVMSLLVHSVLCDGYPFVPTHNWGMCDTYSLLLLFNLVWAFLAQYRGPVWTVELYQATLALLVMTCALALFVLVIVTAASTRYLEPLCALAVLLGVIRCTERQYRLLQLSRERHEKRVQLTAMFKADK